MKVKLPDGKIAEFPDGTPPAEIESALQRLFLEKGEQTAVGKQFPRGMPTPQTPSFTRQLFPTGGDIAASFAVNPLIKRFLPGAMGAGVAPSAMKAFLQAGKQTAARGGAAAAGGATGELLGQQFFGEKFQPKAAGQEAILGAIGETALTPIGAVLKRLYKPTMRLLKDLSFMGQRVTKSMRAGLIDRATRNAEKFLRDIAPDTVKANLVNYDNIRVAARQAGGDISGEYKMFSGVIKNYFEKNQNIPMHSTQDYLYNIREQAQEGIKVLDRPEKTKAMINEFGQGISPTTEIGRRLLGFFHDGTANNPGDIEFVLSRLYGRSQKVWRKTLSETSREVRLGLKKAMLDDLKAVGTIEGLDSGTMDVMLKNANKLSQDLYQFNKTKAFYERAMIEIDPKTGEMAFQPARFVNNVLSSKKYIIEEPNLGPKVWEKLKSEAEFYKGFVTKLKESRGTGGEGVMAQGARALAQVGGPTGIGLVFGPGAIAVSEGFGMASAYALMSESARNVLEGFFKHVLKPGAKVPIHIGGRALFPVQSQQQPQLTIRR